MPEKRQELEYRMNLVDRIYELSKAINAKGKYYAFFELLPHVNAVDVRITPKEDYSKCIVNFSLYHYESDYESHLDMTIKLSQIVLTLEEYLEK